jgi:hypothetical protein
MTSANPILQAKVFAFIIPKECVISSRPEFNEEYLSNIDDNIAEVLNLEKLLEII